MIYFCPFNDCKYRSTTVRYMHKAAAYNGAQTNHSWFAAPFVFAKA